MVETIGLDVGGTKIAGCVVGRRVSMREAHPFSRRL